jgi:hypothetical protein
MITKNKLEMSLGTGEVIADLEAEWVDKTTDKNCWWDRIWRGEKVTTEAG